MSLGKKILEVIEENGIEVTIDLDYPSLPDFVQDECVRVLVIENDEIADECIPLGSSNVKEESPTYAFYELPGCYIAGAFKCVDEFGVDSLNTEALLNLGWTAEYMFETLRENPNGFFNRVNIAARAYLEDKINELILEAIPEFIKGDGQCH